MSYAKFSIYYVKLWVSVFFGFHPTANPLGIVWRWKYWRHRQHLKYKTNR